MLRRLKYPVAYYDMMPMFGRSIPALCRIYIFMVDLIYNNWNQTIYFAKHIDRTRLMHYATAIHNKGAPTTNVYGFPDGTKVETCRPISNVAEGLNLQKEVYSSHKRRHCLNFQGVTAPDGLCIHFFGPLEGRRHDTTLLRHSNLLSYFEENIEVFEGFMIYGDPAYGLSKWIMVGYKGNNIDDQKAAFNRFMSQSRQSVEWYFGRMKTLWANIMFKLQQKVLLSPVGKFVCVAMCLTNLHCCIYRGNQISSYFNCDPPSLEEYLCG
ncbi:hypothetical protein AeNC1_018918 [Aphanomyces euteiches]|nr:hypothetical protein AeNC1_018918 [Aphanomyces euteiches]